MHRLVQDRGRRGLLLVRRLRQLLLLLLVVLKGVKGLGRLLLGVRMSRRRLLLVHRLRQLLLLLLRQLLTVRPQCTPALCCPLRLRRLLRSRVIEEPSVINGVGLVASEEERVLGIASLFRADERLEVYRAAV